MKTTPLLFSLLLTPFLFCGTAHAFGAIAVGDADPKATDASTEQYFVASAHPSREAANDAALGQCRAKGLHFCHVSVWFDACAAYAKSATQSGSAWAATADEAQRVALASCGEACTVQAAPCEPGK